MSFAQQMSDIGSEVGRSITWKEKNNEEYSIMAFKRALEFVDKFLSTKQELSKLKEVARVREVYVDFIVGDNIYSISKEDWSKYFFPFNYLARK